MDQIYVLLLIFVPVPVILLSAIILEICDRQKQSVLVFNQLQPKALHDKFWSRENHKIGQPSAS